jgi:hypothetical protein
MARAGQQGMGPCCRCPWSRRSHRGGSGARGRRGRRALRALPGPVGASGPGRRGHAPHGLVCRANSVRYRSAHTAVVDHAARRRGPVMGSQPLRSHPRCQASLQILQGVIKGGVGSWPSQAIPPSSRARINERLNSSCPISMRPYSCTHRATVRYVASRCCVMGLAPEITNE